MQLAPGTSAGPSHASEMGLRLVCVKKPVATRPSPPQTRPELRWERCRGIFKEEKWKIFITLDLISS